MKGPYYKNIDSFYSHAERMWYRTTNGQKVRTPLPYTFRQGENTAIPEQLRWALSPSYVAQFASYSSGKVGEALDQLHNRAYNAWVSKVKGSVNLGQDLAEAAQTMKLIDVTLGALRRPMETLAKEVQRNRHKGGGKQQLGTISSVWLAFHFGVEPLLKTLYELLDKQRGEIYKNRQVTVSRKRSIQYTLTDQSNVKQTVHATCMVRISGWVGVSNMDIATLESLGLLNPLSVAWEVVPFSFVVDWFYPIGLYLQSLTNLDGRNVTNGYATRYYTTTLNTTYIGFPYIQPSLGTTQFKNVPFACHGVGMSRDIGVPGPVLQKVTNPWSTSLTRAVTSIALLTQGFRKY